MLIPCISVSVATLWGLAAAKQFVSRLSSPDIIDVTRTNYIHGSAISARQSTITVRSEFRFLGCVFISFVGFGPVVIAAGSIISAISRWIPLLGARLSHPAGFCHSGFSPAANCSFTPRSRKSQMPKIGFTANILGQSWSANLESIGGGGWGNSGY